MAIISNKKKLCFIHIHRTGGGTVTELLNQQVNDLVITPYLHSTLFNTIKCNPIVEEYTKFAFVRNPYDWVISLYSSAIDINYNNKDYAELKNMSLYTFVEWLQNVAMKREESKYSNFYRTQTDFLYINNKLAVDIIYQYEGMCDDAGTSNINSLFLNLNLIMPKIVPLLNKSERQFNYIELFDNKTIRLVNKIFKDDFINFNYKINEL
jgi:hypothetical protein